MAVDPSGILAEEVDVTMAIHRSERAAISRCEGDRERIGVKDGACVAARKVVAGDHISLVRRRVAIAEGAVSLG